MCEKEKQVTMISGKGSYIPDKLGSYLLPSATEKPMQGSTEFDSQVLTFV